MTAERCQWSADCCVMNHSLKSALRRRRSWDNSVTRMLWRRWLRPWMIPPCPFAVPRYTRWVGCQRERAAEALCARLVSVSDELFLDAVDSLGNFNESAYLVPAFRAALCRKRLVPIVGPDFLPELTGQPDRQALIQAFEGRRMGTPPFASLAQALEATILGPKRRRADVPLLPRYTEYLREPG